MSKSSNKIKAGTNRNETRRNTYESDVKKRRTRTHVLRPIRYDIKGLSRDQERKLRSSKLSAWRKLGFRSEIAEKRIGGVESNVEQEDVGEMEPENDELDLKSD